MSCRYTYKGQTYEAWDFEDVLKSMSPSEASAYMPSVRSIPDAPFVKTTDAWLSLALKKVIHIAATNGYDKVAFVNGDQSADRYDLSKQVKQIRIDPSGPDEHTIKIYDLNDNTIFRGIYKDGKVLVSEQNSRLDMSSKGFMPLEDVVGKDVAQKAISDVESFGKADLRDLDLKIGGSGMRAFYDVIIPNTVNALLKKLGGGKVETVEFGSRNKWSIVNDRTGKAHYWYDQSDAKELATAGAERFNRDAKITGGDTFTAKQVDKSDSAISEQPGFTITDAIRDKAAGGMPLFSAREDLFPDDFATKQTTVDTGIQISSNGKTKQGGNVNSEGQQITATKQGLKNFWNWFKNSDATDVIGKPLLLYHSTDEDIEAFETGRKSMNNFGLMGNVEVTRSAIFATPDSDFSQEYLNKDRKGNELAGSNVMPVYMSLQNALDLRDPDATLLRQLDRMGVLDAWNSTQNVWMLFDNNDDGSNPFVDALKARDYDGAIFHENDERGRQKETYAAFAPEQMKSALGNRGTFDADDGRVNYSMREHVRALVQPEKDLKTAQWMLEQRQGKIAPDHPLMASGKRSVEKARQAVAAVAPFWKWFGSSKVLDDAGLPLVVFHGTRSDVPVFRPNSRGAYWASTSDVATTYAGESEGANLMPLFLRMENPLEVDAQGVSFRELRFEGDRLDADDLASIAKDRGHDGLIIRNFRDKDSDDGGDEVADHYAVFEKNQLKSVTGNNGAYSLDDDRINYSQREQINTPAFKEWFGDSKVVDAHGKPLVVYHGTNQSISAFDPARSIFDDGSMFFSSSSDTAEQYARDSGGRARKGMNITPVYLSMQNPLVVDFNGEADLDGLMDAREQALSEVRDGVIALNVDDGYGVATQYVAFNPTKIKSATGNNGAYALDDDRINYSQREHQSNFEVAPDPNDMALSQSWNALPLQTKLEISKRVANNIVPRILAEYAATGDIVEQIGSYLDDTNPSFALKTDSPNIDEISRAIGHVLAQDSMMNISRDPFEGSDKVAAVSVEIGKKNFAEVKAIYDAIRSAVPEVGGQSYSGMEMVILNYSDTPNEELMQKIDSALSGKYNVSAEEFHSSFPEKKDYHHASRTNVTGAQGASGPVLWQRLDRLRAEASQLIWQEIADGTKYSSREIIGRTNRTHTPGQLAAFARVGFEVEVPSLKERAQALWKDAGKKLAQGIIDQFAPIKELDLKAYGLLRLAKGASGAFETILRGGKLKLTDGVYDFDETQKGGVVDKLLIPMNGEHHDFLRWVAANRAERLIAEGKENLFTQQDIDAIKTLQDGNLDFDYTIQNGPRTGQVTRLRSDMYQDSLITFNGFNKNVMDMAEQSGLIDADSRSMWEHEFYVPFYRVSEENGFAGATLKGGAVRQQAFKKLKGGKDMLNADLLDNTLMNWAHLLDASAKNRAAKASLEAAESMGVAINASEETARQMGKASGNRNGVVWFMDEGKQRYFLVDDPFVLQAITSLEYAGMRNPMMNAMGAVKSMLTIGVTASPFFKVRNLIRDSIQVVGTGNINYNVAKNLKDGWKLTNPKNDVYFRLLAGGGTIHFGTMLEGSEAKRVQALVESGVSDSTILNDEHKIKAFYRKFIEPGITAYNELGNRGEAINRAALYDQLVKQGVSHADASLQARDLMDFSMQGSFTTVRFLTQVVPFLNARIQGMAKLGRAAKEDPRRMAYVTGAVALASLGLLAAYGDDEDWMRRENWDRNNYWWFKFGGTAFRIPKPFEIGAIGTLAERSAELMFNTEMTSKRFGEQVLALLGDNLSMNPIPQLVKPMLDVYANKNSFNNRPIETLGMEKLKSEYRFTGRTSMTARAASTALNAVTGVVGKESLSPVQIDSLIQGYFGWLGTFIVDSADIPARYASDQPTRPAMDVWKAASGGIISQVEDAPSRYVSHVYDQAREIEQAYGTWRSLLKEGKREEAAEFKADNQDKIRNYRNVEAIKGALAKINQQIRLVEKSDRDRDAKREEIRRLNARKDQFSRRLAA